MLCYSLKVSDVTSLVYSSLVFSISLVYSSLVFSNLVF